MTFRLGYGVHLASFETFVLGRLRLEFYNGLVWEWNILEILLFVVYFNSKDFEFLLFVRVKESVEAKFWKYLGIWKFGNLEIFWNLEMLEN